MAFVSYAQNFEDILLWRALRHLEKGFYIDVGAADPTVDSVTRNFYERGWCGINIEPVPEFFQRLIAARPNDVNLQIVLGEKPGEVPFFMVPGSGLSTTVPEVAEAARQQGWRTESAKVRMQTLAEICKLYTKPTIHFLKIDVEGAEREVLAGADFATYRPWIVLVEATFPTTQKSTHAEWEPLLLSARYRFVWFDGLSRFYVAEERCAELAHHFELPVNVFDDFVRFDSAYESRIAALTHEVRVTSEQLSTAHSRLAATEQRLAASEEKGNLARARLVALYTNYTNILANIYASTSWRVTAPLRSLSQALRAPFRHGPTAAGSDTAVPLPERKICTKRPTIYVECTHTYLSDVNTGIQRVVRNIVRYAPVVAQQLDYDIVPVIFENGTFVRADAEKVLANKANKEEGSKSPNVPDPTQQLPSAHWDEDAPLGIDNYISHNGNILLLLDCSWGSDIWPAVIRFKEGGGHVVGVIYDLIPVTHSHACVEPLVIAFRNWLKNHLYFTDSFVAISRSTKKQIEEFFASEHAANGGRENVPVSFFYLGSELDFIDPSIKPREHIRSIFSGSTPTFLVVGSIEPRKNPTYILDAFDELWRGVSDASLVIIGKRDWKSDDFLARVNAHPLLGRKLHVLRDASDNELDFAYRNASALIIASEIEGLGLPIVEAFQRGLPVLCSDIPVFREVAEGRATFFGLETPRNLARAVAGFIRDADTQKNSKRSPQLWLTWRESTMQLFDAIAAQVKAKKQGAAAEARAD